MSERTIEIFFENLRRYWAGEPLLNVVDKAAEYLSVMHRTREGDAG